LPASPRGCDPHRAPIARYEWPLRGGAAQVPIPAAARAQLRRGEAAELVLTSKALNAAWNVQPSEAKPNW
jgi:hypothetical protein